MSTKRKQTATNGESIVARSKKRNPKLFSLWKNIDNNRKEVNENKEFVRPGGNKGGRIIDFKVELQSGSIDKSHGFFPQILHIGRVGAEGQELPGSTTSISGEDLAFSFHAAGSRSITGIIPKHLYKINLINPGYHWKVGDNFKVQKFINWTDSTNNAVTTVHLKFTVTKINKHKK